jgi:hypothetical protein
LAIRTNPGSIFAGNLRQTADRIVKAIAPWRIDKQATRQQLDKQAARQRLDKQAARQRLDKQAARQRLDKQATRQRRNDTNYRSSQIRAALVSMPPGFVAVFYSHIRHDLALT